MRLLHHALAGLALVTAACGRAKTPDSGRPPDSTGPTHPAHAGLYASVAADTAVTLKCARYLMAAAGQDSCVKAEHPLDTMIRRGFGNFAPLPRALRACAHPGVVDTLVYGRITTEPKTGDYTGSEFTFQIVGDSIRGFSREGEGGVSGPDALQGLRSADDSGASLQFWTTGGGRTKLEFRVVPACASLAAKFRFVDVANAVDTGKPSAWYSPKPLPARRANRSAQ